MAKELEDLLLKMNNTFDEMKKADQKKEKEFEKFGEASAETKKQIDKMNADITKFQEQINELAKKANRIGAGGTEQKSADEIKKEEIFFKFMREGFAGITREEKALVEDATGDIIVPYDVDNEIYRALPALNVIRGLANVRNTNSDRIRRVNMNELTVGWGKLETNNPAGKKLADYESTLVPAEQYAYVEDALGLTKIGEDELEDSNINLQAYLADSFGQAMARLEEIGFLKGTGHANAQPEGLLSAGAALGRFDTAAAATLTADDMLKLQYQTPAQVMQKGVYMINPAIELAIRLMKDTQGQYLWQPALTAGAPSSFGGKAIHLCSAMDAATTTGQEVAIFGDFNLGYQILDRKVGYVTRINELYINDGLIGFKYKRRVGGYVRRKEAFKVLKVK